MLLIYAKLDCSKIELKMLRFSYNFAKITLLRKKFVRHFENLSLRSTPRFMFTTGKHKTRGFNKLFTPHSSGPSVIKLFSSVIYECLYKLECLSLAGLSSLA